MNLQVVRLPAWATPNSTGGMLSLDGIFQCYTLEPRMDRSQGKPYAIPAGTYLVRLLESPHFTALMANSERMQHAFGHLFPDGKVITPHLVGVPGFDFVELHPGNKPEDTDGCTLVGETRGADYLGASDMAFRMLMNRLLGANDPIFGQYFDGIDA